MDRELPVLPRRRKVKRLLKWVFGPYRLRDARLRAFSEFGRVHKWIEAWDARDAPAGRVFPWANEMDPVWNRFQARRAHCYSRCRRLKRLCLDNLPVIAVWEPQDFYLYERELRTWGMHYYRRPVPAPAPLLSAESLAGPRSYLKQGV